MASIKGLKKDVDCLASAVISDCINYAIYAQRHDDEVSELVNDIISYRNDIRARIADGKRIAKAERKSFYTTIGRDMLAKTDECFAKLSELVQA